MQNELKQEIEAKGIVSIVCEMKFNEMLSKQTQIGQIESNHARWHQVVDIGMAVLSLSGRAH